MQIDASKMGDALPYLHLLWSGPVTLIIATVGPFRFLGVARLGESSGEMAEALLAVVQEDEAVEVSSLPAPDAVRGRRATLR